MIAVQIFKIVSDVNQVVTVYLVTRLMISEFMMLSCLGVFLFLDIMTTRQQFVFNVQLTAKLVLTNCPASNVLLDFT